LEVASKRFAPDCASLRCAVRELLAREAWVGVVFFAGYAP
jgi:hypothetical protein